MNSLGFVDDCAPWSAVRDGILTPLMSPGSGCARTSSLTSLRQSPVAPGCCFWQNSRGLGARFHLQFQRQIGELMFSEITSFMSTFAMIKIPGSAIRIGLAVAGSSNPTLAGCAGCLAQRSQGGGSGAARTGGHERSQAPSVHGGPS